MAFQTTQRPTAIALPEPYRIVWRVSLIRLIAIGYGLDFDQISGPKWMGSERYQIDALVPAGTTKDQFASMIKALLEERFHFRGQLSRKEFPAYELIVSKEGPKLW